MIIFKEFPSDFKNHIKAKFDEILYKVSSANAETFKTENCGYDVDGNLHAQLSALGWMAPRLMKKYALWYFRALKQIINGLMPKLNRK